MESYFQFENVVKFLVDSSLNRYHFVEFFSKKGISESLANEYWETFMYCNYDIINFLSEVEDEIGKLTIEMLYDIYTKTR